MEPETDDITKMSLDDYIAKFGVGKNEMYHAKQVTKHNNSITKFNRYRDSFDEDEEMDESDNCLVLNTDTSGLVENDCTQQNNDDIWHGPDSNISYIDCLNPKNDLRNKLENNKCTPVASIQDRLKIFNSKSSCLITVTNPNLNQTNRKNNRNNYWRRKIRNRNGKFHINGYSRKTNRNGNNNGSRNGLHGTNNGRNNRKHVQPKSNFFVNCTTSNIPNGIEPLRNVICAQPEISTSNESNVNRTQNMAACETDNKNAGNVSLKELIGIDNKSGGDPLVAFAKRLMEMAKNATDELIHKPVYDMKIQKDIHERQNKQLFYKSPDGAVVSFDGKGIKCKVTPETSGLTLNCRFS